VVLSGATLYGTTSLGGDYNRGTVYSVKADGTGFTLLHSFFSGDDGDPRSRLVISGSTLYGTSGAFGSGTVFKLNSDGTGYEALHEFTGAGGVSTLGGVVLSGSTLYGAVASGGPGDFGSIYKLNTDGTGFALIHNFLGGTNDGSGPEGTLTLVGSTLYGTTSAGGSHNDGTIFKVNTDGTGYALLHEFNAQGGGLPNGDLTFIGTSLYGTTYWGGQGNFSTIFTINLNGTGFSKIYDFGAHGANAADGVVGGLVTDGTNLFGATRDGGNGSAGTLFKLKQNGTGFAELQQFGQLPEIGLKPQYGPLLLGGGKIYGTTSRGGIPSFGGFSAGTLYAYPVAEPSSLTTAGLALTCCCAWIGRSLLQTRRGVLETPS
jgi:uncharacterized repeat protein (TIGR03803 family)